MRLKRDLVIYSIADVLSESLAPDQMSHLQPTSFIADATAFYRQFAVCRAHQFRQGLLVPWGPPPAPGEPAPMRFASTDRLAFGSTHAPEFATQVAYLQDALQSTENFAWEDEVRELAASGDAAASDELLKDASHLLLDQARIADGEAPADPAEFSRRLTSVMQSAL